MTCGDGAPNGSNVRSIASRLSWHAPYIRGARRADLAERAASPLTIIGVNDEAPSHHASQTSPQIGTEAIGDTLMTWTKLGDEFSDTAAPLSDAAFRTHVEALGWSNRRLLDLLIPKSQLKRFAETDDPDTAVKELVESGWWQDTGDAWFVGCRFPEWQRDRVQVERRREAEAIRQRRKRRHDLGEHDLCVETSRCRSGVPVQTRPGPSRPDPGHAVTPHVTEQAQLGQCRTCDHREPLGPDGRCRSCVEWDVQEEAR